MIKYQVGDKFQAKYTDAPVAPEQQYRIGECVEIRSNGKLTAIYRVEQTDDTDISGVIVEVFNDRFPSTDPAAKGRYEIS